MARGTFYLYFKGKQQVFLAIVEEFHARIRHSLEALDDRARETPTEAPRAVLQASFRAWLQFFASQRDAARVILLEARSIDPRFEEGYAALRRLAVAHFAARFRMFQQRGTANPVLDPEFAAHLQLGMFDELLNAFVLRDEPSDLDALARQLTEFEWNGIRPRLEEPQKHE